MNREQPIEPPLHIDEARARIRASVTPVVGVEDLPIARARGRVLAGDLVAPCDVPAHDNSAMDGYALPRGPRATRYRVIGAALAGHPWHDAVPADGCVGITTGAVVPPSCDAVVPIEQVTREGDRVALTTDIRAGQHVRRAGEDLPRGSIALERGRRLQPADLGLAASLGIATLTVMRRLRVAVFSTGDELRDLHAPLEPGTVHDSNRTVLLALLQQLGAEAIDLGIAPDDPQAIAALLDTASEIGVDAIVTSGGVSAGDADHMRRVVAERGAVAYWQLAIRPGRPMAFGRLAGDGPLLYALPGNPVAVMVVFHALVRDALLRAMGAEPGPPLAITAVSDTRIAKAPGRTEFVRGIATRDAQNWHVRTTGDQGSGILRSMSEANCLIVLPHARGAVAPGDVVEAWPFEGLS